MKCYFCVSSSSWDDCKTQEMTCPSSADRCAKIYSKEKIHGNTITGYSKSCVPESSCKDYKSIPACQRTEECQLDCCSGDLCNTADRCNTAAMQVVSVVFRGLNPTLSKTEEGENYVPLYFLPLPKIQEGTNKTTTKGRHRILVRDPISSKFCKYK